MEWWEWSIVVGLWAWVMVDMHRLRQAVDVGLRTMDQRRIDNCHELDARLHSLERPTNYL